MTECERPANRLLPIDAAHGPRLLVSVRSADEAVAALAGGADILDVKEPTRGSLGMASLEVIASIASQIADACPLSVALGEVADWNDRDLIPALPGSVAFAKLGLSRFAHTDRWCDEWLQVRNRFQQRTSSPLEWVAVAYADAQKAAAPPIDDILDAAIATDCAGLLIDTFGKSGFTLTDCCDIDSLNEIAQRCHAAGLFLALAGRLTRESLPELCRVPANVFAIRSAACEQTDRTARVSTPAVAAFHRALREEGVKQQGSGVIH